MTREEFYAMPKISDYFPLTFESGNQQWTCFEPECGNCQKYVRGEEVRGYVVPIMGGGGPYRGGDTTCAYHLTAQALCPRCVTLTRLDYILHETMTFTRRDGKGGEVTLAMRKLTLWERFMKAIGL